jgi:hypothetical protein
MNDWRTALRDADAGTHAQLPPDHAQAMRRAVLAAVPPAVARPPRLWLQPLLVAATIALMIGTGAVAGRRAAVHAVPGGGSRTLALPADAREPRQLQFATPGGTRIIWVFNPEFDRNESIP